MTGKNLLVHTAFHKMIIPFVLFQNCSLWFLWCLQVTNTKFDLATTLAVSHWFSWQTSSFREYEVTVHRAKCMTLETLSINQLFAFSAYSVSTLGAQKAENFFPKMKVKFSTIFTPRQISPPPPTPIANLAYTTNLLPNSFTPFQLFPLMFHQIMYIYSNRSWHHMDTSTGLKSLELRGLPPKPLWTKRIAKKKFAPKCWNSEPLTLHLVCEINKKALHAVAKVLKQ